MAYCEDTDLFNVFGQDNVEKWADANNNEDSGEIADRITWAIEYADSEIDARLSVIFNDLPFSTVPTLIKNISAMKAGVNLYGLPRALVDGDDQGNMIMGVNRRVEDTLDKLVMGKLRLSDQDETSGVIAVVKATS